MFQHLEWVLACKDIQYILTEWMNCRHSNKVIKDIVQYPICCSSKHPKQWYHADSASQFSIAAVPYLFSVSILRSPTLSQTYSPLQIQIVSFFTTSLTIKSHLDSLESHWIRSTQINISCNHNKEHLPISCLPSVNSEFVWNISEKGILCMVLGMEARISAFIKVKSNMSSVVYLNLTKCCKFIFQLQIVILTAILNSNLEDVLLFDLNSFSLQCFSFKNYTTWC